MNLHAGAFQDASTFQKAPCSKLYGYLALKGFRYPYFGVYVSTIVLLGPFGFGAGGHSMWLNTSSWPLESQPFALMLEPISPLSKDAPQTKKGTNSQRELAGAIRVRVPSVATRLLAGEARGVDK